MTDGDSGELVGAADAVAVFNALADVLSTADPDDARWELPAAGIDWSCRFTLAHIADCGVWYAALLARNATTPNVELAENQPTTAVPVLIDSVRSSGALLGAAVTAAAPTDRGAHPFGLADRSGFAAMGCDETLIHGADIAATLGLPFDPPRDICRRVVARLFPWVRTDAEPWATLQFANGRAPLDGVEPARRWMWQCAPLSEWDGKPRA